MRFPIWFKMSVFLAVVVAVFAGIVWYATDRASQYVVYREYVDLRDEAYRRGFEDIGQPIRTFRERVLMLSASGSRLTEITLADFDLAPSPSAASNGNEPAEIERVFVQAAILESPNGGPFEPTDVSLRHPRLENADARLQRLIADKGAWLREVAEQRDPRGVFSPIGREQLVWTVRAGTGEEGVERVEETDEPVLWLAFYAGIPINGGARVLVAAMSLQSMMRDISESPRHLVFVTDSNRTFWAHPDPAMMGMDASDSVLADECWFDGVELQRRAESFDDLLEDDGRLGQNTRRRGYDEWPEIDLLTLQKIVYAQSSSLPLPADEEARRVEANRINEVLDRVRAEMQARQMGIARLAPFSTSIGTVRMRAAGEGQYEELRGMVVEELRSANIPVRSIEWSAIDCRQFKMHVMQIPYDATGFARSGGQEGYLRVTQLVSPQEIRREVAERMDVIRLLWPMTLGLLVLALSLAWLVTNPLLKMTRAADAISKTDYSGSWDRAVAHELSRLPERRRDEIGTLAAAFRRMIDQIRASYMLLEERVSERTRELRDANERLASARDSAQRLNQETNRFLINISHDLRTPLTVLCGHLNFLAESDLDEEARADLEDARESAKDAILLCNDLLDFQKTVVEGFTLEPAEFDLRDLLESIHGHLRIEAQRHENTLVLDCGDKIGTMYADERRVRQILTNLLSNACKFTSEGTVYLRARLHRDPGGGEWVVLQVKDTGIGMNDEQLQKLFTPFAKLSTREGNRSGTGLGLVICKNFCELMRGSIRVKSELGRGTTFTVRLPRDSREWQQSSSNGEEDSSISSSIFRPGNSSARLPVRAESPLEGDGPLVLVVDDDAKVRGLMQRYLHRHGFRVATAGDGLEGLQKARELRPDVITLDVVMPDPDGWTVLSSLKSDPDTESIPVLMVTMLDQAEKGMALGADEFVMKPVDWEKLPAKIASCVAPPRSDRSILIVDDDAKVRRQLRRCLERDGWPVSEAENGAAALELIDRRLPAAIVLDLIMPVMDGFDFLEEFHKREGWEKIPVLVVTGAEPSHEEHQLLVRGVSRIIQKDLSTADQLLREIHIRLQRRLGQPCESEAEDTG